MEALLIGQLETPCIVIERSKAEENIWRMQAFANQAGVDLRPHIKTHKMVEYARLQLEYGACGITCAKVSEAEVMADGGIDDIFIAYPLVGEFRIQRALKLYRKCRRLILAVDSDATARMLSQAASREGISAEVRLEVDIGAGRTGVPIEDAVSLAQRISSYPSIHLTGIYAFKSMIYQGHSVTDRRKAGEEEGQLMKALAAAMWEKGLHIKDVSAGSTPTGDIVAATGKVTEIRPGTYIFNDYMLCCEGWASPEKIAGHIYVTVVSTPRPGYAVIDGGSKTFPMDILLHQPPYYYPGYGVIEGRPDLRLARLNEEHGIIESSQGDTRLKVGQVLKLTPIHICTAVNMQNTIYEYSQRKLRRIPVDARGMLV